MRSASTSKTVSPSTQQAWQPRPQRAVDFCRRWAVPSGVVMFVLLLVQANTGVLSGYRRDATVRSRKKKR